MTEKHIHYSRFSQKLLVEKKFARPFPCVCARLFLASESKKKKTKENEAIYLLWRSDQKTEYLCRVEKHEGRLMKDSFSENWKSKHRVDSACRDTKSKSAKMYHNLSDFLSLFSVLSFPDARVSTTRLSWPSDGALMVWLVSVSRRSDGEDRECDSIWWSYSYCQKWQGLCLCCKRVFFQHW